MATFDAAAQFLGRAMRGRAIELDVNSLMAATGTDEDVIRELLRIVGEDPEREGLKDTPRRVLAAWREMTAGYGEDPAEILSTRFARDGYDEMVLLRGVHFTSACEHHMLPFTGEAAVAYLPKETVVGLSKMARLVQCYARRLQIQERMTVQIAQALETHLQPMGVGVVVRAKHQCMACRGVRSEQAEMVTSCVLGTMRESQAARQEFLNLVLR